MLTTRLRSVLGRQLRRFVVVGVANVAIDLAVYNLLVLAFPTRDNALLVVYNTTAIVVSMANSWVFNSRWTFEDRTRQDRWDARRAKILFGVQYAVGIAINDVGIVFLTELGRSAGYRGLLLTNGAKLSAIAASCCFSFLMMRLAVFAAPDGQRGAGRISPSSLVEGELGQAA